MVSGLTDCLEMGREEKPTVTWNHVQGAVWRGGGRCYVA